MTLGYDPDIPAGYQDADIELAEMHAEANELASEGKTCGSECWGTYECVYNSHKIADQTQGV